MTTRDTTTSVPHEFQPRFFLIDECKAIVGGSIASPLFCEQPRDSAIHLASASPPADYKLMFLEHCPTHPAGCKCKPLCECGMPRHTLAHLEHLYRPVDCASTPAERCPKCRHMPHGPGGCLNVASDHDCNCGEPDRANGAADAPCWLCDFEANQDSGDRVLLLLFVAAMPEHERAMCATHREAWKRTTKSYRKAVRP